MNIGAFACRYGMGGSQNSTITLCNALAQRGHSVTLYCPAKQMFSYVRPQVDVCDIPVNEFEPFHFRNVSISNAMTVAGEVKRREHDILLSFNHASLIMLMPVILTAGIPCVHYVLGPIAPLVLRLHRGAIVANSEETRDILANALSRSREDIAVVRGRVSVDVLENELRKAQSTNPYNPPAGIRQIGMMSRLDSEQIEGIYQAIDAIAILAQARRDFRLLLAGAGDHLPQIRVAIEKMNNNAGREVAKAVGYVGAVGHFIQAAEICTGIGRCAFEAMAFGKPTLIVGQHGYAGTVLPNEIDELAYFNFSGRNIKKVQPPNVLAERLNMMLDNPELLSESGLFAKSYYRDNLDVHVGAKQLDNILSCEMESPDPSRLQCVALWAGYCVFCCLWIAKGLFSRLFLPSRRRVQLDKISKFQRDAKRFAMTSDV
jgi:glycosyltransferase involved in cell wall biosynthesis